MNAPQDFNAVLEQLPISSIRPSPFKAQTLRRSQFSSVKMIELAASIAANGVLQPILVRNVPVSNNTKFEIVAGERRWIAADRAGLAHIPATVRDMTDEQVLEAQLVENLQREGLHALEEAEGYAELMALTKITAEEVGDKIGKSRSYVYARLKLLDLIPDARKALSDGTLDASKALVIARIKGEKMQARALKTVTDMGENYSYRRLMDQLRNDCMIPIAQAPWLPDRDTLHLPKTGEPVQACDTCTTRSCNDPELDEVVQGKDVCVDRACFDLKTKLHFARLRHDYEAQGKTILTGEAALHVLDTRTGYFREDVKNGMVRLDAECDTIEFDEPEPKPRAGQTEDDLENNPEWQAWAKREDEFKAPTYRELLGSLPEAQVVQTKSGKLIEVAPIAAVAKALKAKGIIPPSKLRKPNNQKEETPVDRAKEAAVRAREEERRRIDDEFNKRLAIQIHAKYKGPLKLQELQVIAGELVDQWTGDAFDSVYTDRVEVERMKEPELLKLMITVLISREMENEPKPQFTLSIAQRLKIDAKKIRAEVVKDLKPVSAPQEEKPEAKKKTGRK